ncbi:MAG: tRNA(His) guanylyltransferase Thg1 family protein [Myxococcota bacterium]
MPLERDQWQFSPLRCGMYDELNPLSRSGFVAERAESIPMNLKALEDKMRVYETAHDHCVLPGLYMVARLDGRRFSRLIRQRFPDPKAGAVALRDHMVATVEALMGCDLRMIYGHTHSDEVSLLLHRDEDSFSRKLRKLNSLLAGIASAAFSLQFGQLATFDCRISQLPTRELVVDYFRWRSENAYRNSVSSLCQQALMATGKTPAEAAGHLRGLSIDDQHLLLHRHDIDIDEHPAWLKRGIGFYWEVDNSSDDPANRPDETKLESPVPRRRRLKVTPDFPGKAEFSGLIRELIKTMEQSSESSNVNT